MSRRRLVVLGFALLLAVNAALWLAQFGLALPANLGTYLFGPKLVRAEVVVKDGVIHDYRIDRGKIRAIALGSLTLLEKDGTMQVIAVASDARVTINGVARPAGRLRVGMTVTTVRDGSAPASELRATK